MQRGISVVIPNYNGAHLFPLTLPSVFHALQQTGLPSEVIVVDDHSTDDSLTVLSRSFPQVLVVSNSKNSGFSITANHGVRTARYELVLLLNSDVRLESGYFNEQLPLLNDPKIFGVMGRIIGWDDDEVQDGAKYPYFHGVKIKTSGNYLLRKEEEMRSGLPSMYLSGANALVRKEIFLALGGFNELFSPFYVEDYELSLRAWRLGYSCFYQHFSVCRHKTSSSVKARSSKIAVREIYNRNKMFLHSIHLEQWQRYLYFIQLFPEALAALLTGKWYYIRALGQLISHYDKVRLYRRQLAQTAKGRRLLSVRQVANHILKPLKEKDIIRF